MNKILAGLLAVFTLPVQGFAQETREMTVQRSAIELSVGRMREPVGRPRLRLAAVPPAAQQQQKGERSWPARHPVLFGALVGAGGGVAVQAVVIPGASGGEPHSVYHPMFAGIGAGVGSLVGLIVSVARRQ